MIYNNISELIGKTPLLRLRRLSAIDSINCELLAKLEFLNPTASSKDRIALKMIEESERKGLLDNETVIVEPTSGDTGIALAAVAAARGYQVILAIPRNFYQKKSETLKTLGAQIILTDSEKGMAGAVEAARSIASAIVKTYIPMQFENENNPEAHRLGTGAEIAADCESPVDILVCPIGSGGTITGCAKALREVNPQLEVIGVEPMASPLLSKGWSACHNMHGIGMNFIPAVLDQSLITEVLTVETADAEAACQRIACTEGLLIGIASGAALHAAIEVCRRPENEGKRIVVIFPDSQA